MNRKAVPVVAVLALVVAVAVFKAVGLAPIMPVAASIEAAFVDQAYAGMLRVTVPIFALVVAVLLYALWAWRARGPSEEGLKFHHSRGGFVEVLWISTSLVLPLSLAAFGAREFRLVRGDDRADLDIQVTASQFSWEFYYPAYNVHGSRLFLPKGKRVRLLLASRDVVHSFWVPEFRTKQDALPGKVVKLYLTPTRSGTYRLQCAELCGGLHAEMTAIVEVLEPDAFEEAMKAEAW